MSHCCGGCNCTIPARPEHPGKVRVHLQGLNELNPEATITSRDGESMMTSLRDVARGGEVCGASSEYLWEDDAADVHKQGEGGEQGDPVMPLLVFPW